MVADGGLRGPGSWIARRAVRHKWQLLGLARPPHNPHGPLRTARRYAFNIVFNILNKSTLNIFPAPWFLATFQLSAWLL